MEKKKALNGEMVSDKAKRLMQLAEQYRLTPEQHAETLQRIIESTFAGKTPVDNPTMRIVIGQTGAGKTDLTKYVLQSNPNSIIINGDNCKLFRPDAEKLSQKYPDDFNAITRYDSHKHMFEVFEAVKDNNYNGIIEKAPSVNFENFWGAYQIPEHYKTEYFVIAVSELNSLLSTRERYEDQITFGAKSPKLTEIARHDDAFLATQMAVEELGSKDVNVFIRGKNINRIPQQVFPSSQFSTATECVNHYRVQDLQKTLSEYPIRFEKLKRQMEQRSATPEQFADLEKIYKRYKVMLALSVKNDQGLSQ